MIAPDDEHNALLVANTHPSDWSNPEPRGRYNLVAIGGGPAGLVCAVGAAGLGGRAALVERQFLGGDCLNFGCVPSKAILRSARAAYDARGAARHAVHGVPEASVDFAGVSERMRRLRAQISGSDSAARLAARGVDVYFGEGRFTGPRTLEVAGATIGFRRCVIATGARPAVPPVEGLAGAGFVTNETVFSLTALPARLVVIGAGPVGCELAQAFRRFGSEVHLVGKRDAILAKEDPQAVAVVENQLKADGVSMHLGWKVVRAERTGRARGVTIERGAERKKLLADEILVAVGRRPNVEGLDLAAAGVRYTDWGVEVDDFLRTTNRAIYAAGDVCSRQRFTHAADAMARLVLRNALFLGRRRASRLVIPRCTYTDPELAHVGMTPAEAERAGCAIDSFRVELSAIDRAVLDDETAGFAVVHTAKGTSRVVGATIVARHAGEMIATASLLMTRRLPLSALAETIFCYPTQVEALKKVAEARERARLTPRLARLAERWLAWRR